MFGWHGKILRVNLTTGEIRAEDVDPQVAQDFIGGRGWAIKYLYDETPATQDPLSPKNKLIFATGPLTGTPAPTGNRYMIVTKSPLTDALACSNSGGIFPTEMKRTGFDMFIFEGRAEKPVYLWVKDSEAEIRPAEHLWGQGVSETEGIIHAETDPRARIAAIGPAGENLVKVAAVINDEHRAAARSGVGAVMGSKNLKAVVVRGTQKTALAEPKKIAKLAKLIRDEVVEIVKKGSGMRIYGTSYVPPVTNELGILPTRNFQTGQFERVDKINGPTLKEKYLLRPKACYGCPLACGRLTRVTDPGLEGEGEGPEYETIASLGSACGIDHLGAVTKANYLCNDLGLDTISVGMTVAAAMEMSERGIIPEADIGRPLRFGDYHALLDFIPQIARREGFGDLLAEGSYRLGEKYDCLDLTVTAKKQEFPGYDSRGSWGMGLLYATSNSGASHMAGDIAYMEVFGVPKKLAPLTTEGKPQYIKYFEDIFALIDAAGLCVFVAIRHFFDGSYEVRPTRITDMMNYATGTGYTQKTLLQAAERIYNLERMYLVRAGFSRKDDTLPRRMLEEPLPEGPGKGMITPLDKMLPEFYRLRGWDKNGIPTPEKLAELRIGSR